MEYVNFQFNSFLLLILTGMVLGVFFDLYRVFRSTITVNKVVDTLGDLLFWSISFLLIGPLIYWSTWLELRLYVWLAIGAGLAVYFIIFSAVLIPVYLKFWKAVTWLPRQTINLIQRTKLLIDKITFSLRNLVKRTPGA